VSGDTWAQDFSHYEGDFDELQSRHEVEILEVEDNAEMIDVVKKEQLKVACTVSVQSEITSIIEPMTEEQY